jgi:prepilin peptidase CpaA
LGTVGAGDVKLAGATGLFLGHPDMLWVNLLILIAGGALALVWAVSTGRLLTTWKNLQSGLTQIWPNRQLDRTHKPRTFPIGQVRLPYALAIGMGTAWHVANTWPSA